jgi:transcriptional regulator with GAF, ATPase, and Fis domain
MPNVWCRFFNGESLLSKTTVRQTLSKAGLAIQDFDRDITGGTGLLFFHEVTQPLCNLVQELSHHGLQRVLAIAVSNSVLRSNNAWRLCQAGASDVFGWDRLADPGNEIKARLERWDAVEQVVNSPLVQNNLVGKSPVWISIMRRIVELAHFTDSTMLILGESGTGKELVARLVHALGAREKTGEFVVLDCATTLPELSGSEFFGHERGAFTGAVQARDGAFALADKGTLFLDEVGELPLPVQAQLLRAVQEHTYKRVGGNAWQTADFRLVCATNKDLFDTVQQGKFRHDLYYRISTWIITLPPLRERRQDILLLARHFIRQLRPAAEPPDLDSSVREYLLRRDYPGNVRELWQVIARMIDRHVGCGPITVGDIPEDDRPREGQSNDWSDEAFERSIHHALLRGAKLKEIGRGAEEAAVRIALSEEQGNLQRAATRLGVTDRALQMRRANGRRPGSSDQA